MPIMRNQRNVLFHCNPIDMGLSPTVAPQQCTHTSHGPATCQRTKKVNIDWMVRADAPSIVEITIESRPTVAFVAKAVVANTGWVGRWVEPRVEDLDKVPWSLVGCMMNSWSDGLRRVTPSVSRPSFAWHSKKSLFMGRENAALAEEDQLTSSHPVRQA